MANSFEEILAIHRLDEGNLDQLCSKEHRDELTKRIKDWKAVGAALGFTQEELDMIDSGFPSEEQKKTALLIQWSMRVGKETTYLSLAKLLFAGGLLDLLQELYVLVSGATPTIPADEPGSGSSSLGVGPSHLPVEESTNPVAESNLERALERYRPESQASGSVSDTLHQSFQKSEPNGANAVKLGERDLVHLMRLLQTYSYKWNPIGLSLGFTPHELCTISSMVTLLVGAPVSYLQELLSRWVQWPTTDHPNHPTLRALCAALRSSLVGLGSLAEKVEREMKQCTTGVALVKSNSDQDVASKIKHLEKQFKHLHRSIRTELKAKENITVEEFLQTLTLLPMMLKKEYEEIILKKLPSL